MRKNIKKGWLSRMLVLATALVITAMPVNAKAAEEPVTNSIEVVNFVNGETYAGYKIFDATVDGDKVAYSIASDSEWMDVVTTSGLFDLTDISATEKSVALKTGKGEADVVEWIQELDASTVSGFTADLAAIATNADTTAVKWNNVPDGYYFITTTLGSVVTVTNANPDCKIIDKNRRPSWDPEDPDNTEDTGKFVKEGDVWSKSNDATIGDTIDYKINVFAPKYDKAEQIIRYVFEDTLPDGISYVADSLSMTIAGIDGNIAAASYTVAVDGQKIKISYKISDIANYPTDAHVSFQYQAVLNDDADVKNTNTVAMQWYTATPDDPDDPGNPDDPDEPEDPGVPQNPNGPTDPDDPEVPDPEDPDDPGVPESTTDTYTYGFTLQKYAGSVASGNELEGVEFNLIVKDESNAETVLAFAFDAATNCYKVSATGATSDIKPIKTMVTKIFGLDAGTYYLRETVTPDGYNPIADEEIVITAPSEAAVAAEGYDGYVKDVTIVNLAGTILPSTGGIGTTVFYVVGGLLVVVAGVLLITKKRMKDAE